MTTAQKKMKFPEQPAWPFFMNPDSAMTHYKLDDRRSIQTLAISPCFLNNIPSHSILGRFIGKKKRKNFILKQLEAKFYTFEDVFDNDLPRDQQVPLVFFRIVKILVDENKFTKKNVTFLLQIERIEGFNEVPNKPDYTYGLDVSEPSLKFRKDASLNFLLFQEFDGDGNPKPIDGGYECNGKAFTGN